MEPESEYSNLKFNMKPGVELRGVAKEEMEFNKYNNNFSNSEFNKEYADYNSQFKISFNNNKNLNQNQPQPKIPMSYYFPETGASSIGSLVK